MGHSTHLLGRAAVRRPAAPASVTVIVPTYNEAWNLPALVDRVLAALPQAEVLVVDDDSPDGTARLALAMAETRRVRVVVRDGERGLATAVARGLAEARTELVAVLDADLSHPPEALPALVRAVETGADVAVGSRYVPGGEVEAWPWRRRLASRAGTLLARPLTPVRDPMAGIFCLRRSLLQGVALRPRGFKILLEILARARPARVVEIPIRFRDRAAGDSKFDAHQRREYLKQVLALYGALNAWPWRLSKFLLVGLLGLGVHLMVLAGLVEGAGAAPWQGAVAGFAAAMTSNYALNRAWTFRARRTSVATSYAAYVAGALGGLGVQLGVMHLIRHVHYAAAAALGIGLGTAVTFLTSQAWAFARRA